MAKHLDAEKITSQKLDSEVVSQFSDMPDQRGTLRTILQGGITPFTNMRSSTMRLGKSVSYRPKNPLNQILARSGTVNVPFALRFHTDDSNKRTNSVMVFRHNKKGRQHSRLEYVVPDGGLTYTNNSGSTVSISYEDSTGSTSGPHSVSDGGTLTIPAGSTIPTDSPAWPGMIVTGKQIQYFQNY